MLKLMLMYSLSEIWAVNTAPLTKSDAMLVHRLRRWANIKPTLVKLVVFTGKKNLLIRVKECPVIVLGIIS